MDQAIADYLKKEHKLNIGEGTAEALKINIGSAVPVSDKDGLQMEIRGQDIIERMPRTIRVNSNDIAEALTPTLKEVVLALKSVLRDTPPELAADVMDRGMIISGGGALLRNIDEMLRRAIGVPAFIAEDPFYCVAKGTGIVLDNLDIYKRVIQSHR